MIFTMCFVPEEHEQELTNVGGVVMRRWGGRIDVQFREHRIFIDNRFIVIGHVYDTDKHVEYEPDAKVSIDVRGFQHDYTS